MNRTRSLKRRGVAGVFAIVVLSVYGLASLSPVAASEPTLGLVGLSVVPCATRFGVTEAQPSLPAKLPVALTKANAARLTFYSNGFMTLLGPRGWSCQALVATDGSEAIEVYRAGSAQAASLPSPDTPAESVYARDDYTGHGPGALLVCAYFPSSPAASFFHGGPPACPSVPAGTTITHLTDDTVLFRLPDTRTGIVIYPQITPEPAAGSNVTLASCRIRGSGAALCDPILQDYTARAYPSTPK